MNNLPAYKIFALSDAALTIDFGNMISNEINDIVISLFKQLQQHLLEGMTEAVPAYSSLTIYYDVVGLRKKVPAEKSVFEWMKNEIQTILQQKKEIYQVEKRLVKIPVCYEKEFAPDLEWATSQLKISVEDIIRIHTSKIYRVYMLGFLPGFAYMGEVDEKIILPRKSQPVQVAAGSVGIAGKQTGVYPLNSPGGWQIIGRTAVKMFKAPSKPSPPIGGKASVDSENRDALENPTLLKAGDSVQFYSISKDEFENIKSRNS
jgi:inhibitor of KinA